MGGADVYRFHIQKIADCLCLKNGKEEITYREFAEAVRGWESYFASIGLKQSRVVLMEKNMLRWMILMFALWCSDCFVLPVPWNIGDGEKRKMKTDIKAKDTVSWKNCIRSKSWDGEDLILRGGVIHRTSGTMGNQKYCMRKSSSFLREGQAYQKTFDVSTLDRVLVLSPLYHSFGFGAAMSAFAAGSELCVMDAFSPQKAVARLEKDKITVLFLVPDMAWLLCCAAGKKRVENSLRAVAAGAGKIKEELFGLFSIVFGVPLGANYGSTETGGIVSRVDGEMYPSVGKPMDGVSLKIIADHGGLAVPGEIGRIWVKSEWLPCGNLHGIQMETDNLGYFATNDIGFADSRGFIFLNGRVNRIINVGGKKFIPMEIEETVEKYPGVRECAAAEYEGKLKIYVVGEKGTEEEIRRFCRQELGLEKIPSLIEFVDRLPKNEMGKVIYKELMEEAWKQRKL